MNTQCSRSSLTWFKVAQFSADNLCITNAPLSVSNSSPSPRLVDFHSTLPLVGTSHQSNITISILSFYILTCTVLLYRYCISGNERVAIFFGEMTVHGDFMKNIFANCLSQFVVRQAMLTLRNFTKENFAICQNSRISQKFLQHYLMIYRINNITHQSLTED